MSPTWTRVRNRAMRQAFPMMFRPDAERADLIRLGSDYGGWWVPRGMFGPDSICYCGGVGMDISFDLGLIETFGCNVWGIDPTPRTAEWIASQDLDPRFIFVPVGISGQNDVLRFYDPIRADHISHSVKNLQRTSTFFEAEVTTVWDLMGRLGHDRIDLVKLDIEGAEHDAIDRMIRDGIRPGVLCVEFDQPEPVSWALGTTKKLRGVGYVLVKVEGFNLTFVHR